MFFFGLIVWSLWKCLNESQRSSKFLTNLGNVLTSHFLIVLGDKAWGKKVVIFLTTAQKVLNQDQVSVLAFFVFLFIYLFFFQDPEVVLGNCLIFLTFANWKVDQIELVLMWNTCRKYSFSQLIQFTCTIIICFGM